MKHPGHPYREPGLKGDIKSRWFYWRLLRYHVAKNRKAKYAEVRQKGANPVGAFLFSYMNSRLIDWPRPYWVRLSIARVANWSDKGSASLS